MASSLISPLRVAGSRLTSAPAGRALATNSVFNAQALKDEEHEAVRQHLDAIMGQQEHLEYRHPMFFKSSPINTQRVLQQDSQSGLSLQSIRSFSTTYSHPASMTSKSMMPQEAEEDINRLHNEVMQQRSQKISALPQRNQSLIIKQGSIHQQNLQNPLAQYHSVRSFHTNNQHQAAITPSSPIAQELDVHRLHNEAMEQRIHRVSSLNNGKSSLITKKNRLQKQTSHNQMDSQFQSVRSLHTNVKMPEFMDENSSSSEIITLNNDIIESRLQHIHKLSLAKSSLITEKSPKNQQNPLNAQFHSVRSFHTSNPHQAAAISPSSPIAHELDSDVHRLHNEAMEQRFHKVASLNNKNSSLITRKSPMQRQSSQAQFDAQFQGVRSIHTNVTI